MSEAGKEELNLFLLQLSESAKFRFEFFIPNSAGVLGIQIRFSLLINLANIIKAGIAKLLSPKSFAHIFGLFLPFRHSLSLSECAYSVASAHRYLPSW
jgi:hypothetical protein